MKSLHSGTDGRDEEMRKTIESLRAQLNEQQTSLDRVQDERRSTCKDYEDLKDEKHCLEDCMNRARSAQEDANDDRNEAETKLRSIIKMQSDISNN
jgi:chromosome segregation ATPase